MSTRQADEARRAIGRAESRARLDGLPHVAKHYAAIRMTLRLADRPKPAANVDRVLREGLSC